MPPEIAFLKAWLEWVERGAPQGCPFYQHVGLCGNLSQFDRSYLVRERFHGLLRYEFGPDDYPFGGPRHYTAMTHARTHHLNAQRIEWVRRMIERYEA